MRLNLSVIAVSTLLLTTPSFALEGVNLDTGDSISVDDATLFTVGEFISVFDAEGNELEVSVQAVTETEVVWNVDVQDQDSGDTVSLEFQKVK